MFGFLYGLFVGGALLSDGFKRGVEDTDAYLRSQDCDYITHGPGGTKYYHGRACREIKDWRGHRVIKDARTNEILRDYTQECVDRHNTELRESWDKAIERAKANGRPIFYFWPLGRLTEEFMDRPRGYYELETMKRYHLKKVFKTNEKGLHEWRFYKYDDVLKHPSYGLENGHVKWGRDYGADESSEIEISKEEFERLGGDCVGYNGKFWGRY